MLPDKSILVGQKFMENAKFEKIQCYILADFQTALWSVVKLGLLLLRLLQDETGLGGCSSTSTEKRERLKHRCYNPLAHIRKMKAQVMPKAKLTKNIFFVNPGVILESRLWINNWPSGAFLMRQFECNTTFNRRTAASILESKVLLLSRETLFRLIHKSVGGQKRRKTIQFFFFSQ